MRKARTLCSTMVDQRTDWSHSKSMVLGENKDTHGISRSCNFKIDVNCKKHKR